MSGNAGGLTGLLNIKPFTFDATTTGTPTAAVSGTVNGLQTGDIVIITGCDNDNVLGADFAVVTTDTVSFIANTSGSPSASVTYTGIMFRPEETPLSNDVIQ